jgi:plasmid maintenance system antidote protein VapI
MMSPEDGGRRSRESLAREMGVSGVALGYLQNGKRAAGRVTITQLARYMDDDQRRLWLELLRLFDQEVEDMREHLITIGREIAEHFFLPAHQVQAALTYE